MRRGVLLTAVIAAMLAAGVDERLFASDTDTWEVVALGPHDEPIPGVLLRLKDAAEPCAETDRNGRARLAPPEDANTLSVVVTGTVQYERHDLVGPKTVLRFPDTIPVDVVVVDARTGRPLTVPSVLLHRDDAPSFALEATGDSHRLGVGLAHAGDGFWGSFEVTPPPGYATTGAGVTFFTDQYVVGAVRLGRIDIPAWPAGKLHLHVVDARGVPVHGPLDTKITAAGEWLPTDKLTLDADGRATVEPVPLVGRGWIEIEVFGKHAVKAAPIRLQPELAEYDADVVLPDEVPSRPGRCGGASGIYVRSPMPGGGTGRLEIHAVRHDGSPARRAAIQVGTSDWVKTVRSDDRGVVTMDDVATRAYGTETTEFRVELAEPGIVPVTKQVTLSTDKLTVVELREPEGSTIELTVVDDEGAPVAWARVGASQAILEDERWYHAVVNEDVQDLSPHTGADGRFVFRNLPPGEVEVSVAFGERFVVKKKIVAGSPATIVLPR